MRTFAALLIACLLIGHNLTAQPEHGFSGSLTVAGQPSTARYPLDGRSEKHPVGESIMNTATKWEGSAFHGEGNKGGDTRTVGETTAGIGTNAGGAAGHFGLGAGIGAATGAAAGLARVLGSRGADVVLAPGTTIELTLDRDLRFSAAELRLGGQ